MTYQKKVKKFYIIKKTIQKDLTDLITKSVEKRLEADVPIGLFLSGGIDSGLILIALSKLGKKIPCFTVGFSESNDYYNETERAASLTKHFGYKHKKIILDAKVTKNALQNILETSDEPFADSSAIPTYLISESSSKHIKVALTGDGGDEIFGGYRKYISYRWKKALCIIPMHLRSLLARNLSDSKNTNIKNFGRKIKRLLQNTESDIKKMQINFLDQLSRDDYYLLFGLYYKNIVDKKLPTELDYSDEINLVLARDMQFSLLSDMLVKLDRYSMTNNLEVRSPFLDTELVEYALSLPGKEKVGFFSGKKVLKNNLSCYFPDNYMDLPKKGFEIPLDKLLKSDLRYLVEDATRKKVISSLNIYEPKIINNWKDEFFKGHKDHSWKLWTLISYSTWATRNSII